MHSTHVYKCQQVVVDSYICSRWDNRKVLAASLLNAFSPWSFVYTFPSLETKQISLANNFQISPSSIHPHAIRSSLRVFDLLAWSHVCKNLHDDVCRCSCVFARAHLLHKADTKLTPNKMGDSPARLTSCVALTLPIVGGIFCCLERDGRIHDGRTAAERTRLRWDVGMTGIHAAQRAKS